MIGTGVLPLQFAPGTNPDTLASPRLAWQRIASQPGDKLGLDAAADTLSPCCKVFDGFSEQMIRNRYGLPRVQLTAVLGRIAQEGWAKRKPGYGRPFSSMLTMPDSLLKSHRLRC